MKRLAIVMVVAALALTTIASSNGRASGRSLGFRTGYSYDPLSYADMPEGAIVSLVGALPVTQTLAVTGCLTYFPSSERPWSGICYGHGWCGNDTDDEDTASLSAGFRYSPGSATSGPILPYIEVAPALYYGRWVHRDRDFGSRVTEKIEAEHFFAGFQASFVIPIRITERTYSEIGVGYLYSQDLSTKSVFGGTLEGFRHLQVLGGLSFRL